MIKDNIDRLYEFLTFEDNWNDHGAEPFTPEHIQYVLDIITKLKEKDQPQIFPTAAHSVHLEWDRNNSIFILDIKKDKTITIFYRIKKYSEEYRTSLYDALIQLGRFLEKYN